MKTIKENKKEVAIKELLNTRMDNIEKINKLLKIIKEN